MSVKLIALREKMRTENLDGFFVTNPFNRRYLSGFTGTSGNLVITANSSDLITDFRYVEQASQQAPDFTVIRHEREILECVGEQVKKQGVKRLAFEQNDVTYALFQKLAGFTEGVELVPVEGIIEELRLIKTPEEIAIIKDAAHIADQAFAHILEFIKPGVTERQVSNELEFAMRRLGATASSFDTIVASGLRSALPHGVATDKCIQSGELVTLDFGAYYRGYCSDITRTIAVGKPDPKLEEIYSVVLNAQLNGVQKVGPGLSGKEADALTRELIGEAGFAEYFGHGTGHGVGLEIHEGPTLSPRGEQRLRPGMVVTVEPGIYVPGLGGVRIEDDVV
ncbi:MAG TPA: Xaa-Pro dipeptidase, partial [Paenibacillaceae bacterium]|nr:Xaa-Pro dipeptidase [Paenibacillaceae bacterium]